ncbi:MAG: hypothetical protein V8T51_02400 [Senegalimassilia faecalis]
MFREILSAEVAGVSAERGSRCSAIFDALSKAGIEVYTPAVQPVRTILRKRPFTRSELLLLVDAVRAMSFMSSTVGIVGSGHQNLLGRKAKRRGLRSVCLLAGA